jgi:hypothetical protein
VRLAELRRAPLAVRPAQQRLAERRARARARRDVAERGGGLERCAQAGERVGARAVPPAERGGVEVVLVVDGVAREAVGLARGRVGVGVGVGGGVGGRG